MFESVNRALKPYDFLRVAIRVMWCLLHVDLLVRGELAVEECGRVIKHLDVPIKSGRDGKNSAEGVKIEEEDGSTTCLCIYVNSGPLISCRARSRPISARRAIVSVINVRSGGWREGGGRREERGARRCFGNNQNEPPTCCVGNLCCREANVKRRPYTLGPASFNVKDSSRTSERCTG